MSLRVSGFGDALSFIDRAGGVAFWRWQDA